MWEILAIAFGVLGGVSLLAWLGVLLHPARPWDLKPVAEDEPEPPEPGEWPDVAVLVPARNEARSLPESLPDLLWQDYPGRFHVFVIDDRSSDGTGEAAKKAAADRSAAGRLTVVAGKPLPEGWVGKVWALQQGAECATTEGTGHEGQGAADGGHPPCAPPDGSAGASPSRLNPKYLLLTDADIGHASDSLRRLVAESVAGDLALNSRMARLRCASFAEKLLIPAFVHFFNLLYPMRRVNDPGSRVAAAAGGCVLLSRSALEEIGTFERIRGEMIDDVSLARAVKGSGRPIRLSLSREAVESQRAYETFGSIWRMVRRSAFTELRHSWLRLAAAVAALLLMFLIPPLFAFGGAGLLVAGTGFAETPIARGWPIAFLVEGILAWLAMQSAYLPATAFYRLSPAWALSMPVAGVLYACMTVDSAIMHLKGRQKGWR